MLRPRIIPCLLIHNGGLVKTKLFSEPKYVGDPINAVRIFNEKEADELIVLDIDATVKGVDPDFKLITKLAAECRMPLCYGGGVTTVEQVIQLVDMGVEKVAISAAAISNPALITEMADAVGSQSVVVVLDVRKRKGLFSKGYEICSHNGEKSYEYELEYFVRELQSSGAGEIMINSIGKDGMMKGYDIDLASKLKQAVSIPLTFVGGAGAYEHFKQLFQSCGIVGAAAGSIFIFKGKYKAVLINYPERDKKIELCLCK